MRCFSSNCTERRGISYGRMEPQKQGMAWAEKGLRVAKKTWNRKNCYECTRRKTVSPADSGYTCTTARDQPGGTSRTCSTSAAVNATQICKYRFVTISKGYLVLLSRNKGSVTNGVGWRKSITHFIYVWLCLSVILNKILFKPSMSTDICLNIVVKFTFA